MSPQSKPSIVFCHGIWADGSCFSKLIPPLRADGHEVIAAEYNLDSHQSDVDSVIRTLGRVSSPAILVGHSYGGSRHHGRGNRRPRRRARLHLRARAGRDRDLAGPTGQVPDHRRVRTDRGRRRAHLAAPGRHRVLRRGPIRGGEADRVGDRDAARREPVQRKGPRASPGGRSRAPTSWPRKTTPSIPSWSGSPPSAWAPRRTKSRAATSRCSPIPTSCSTRSVAPPTRSKAPQPSRRCSRQH